MLEVIKQLYRDNLIEDVQTYEFDHYYYFLMDEKPIGIKKDTLSNNEFQLIKQLVQEIKPEQIEDERHKLLDFLFGQEVTISSSHLKFYFLKVFNLDDETMTTELYHLLKESYQQDYVTRRNDIYIIVSEQSGQEGFYEMLQSIESDFMIKLIGFESEYYEVNENLPEYFQLAFNSLNHQRYINDLLISKSQLLVNHMVSLVDAPFKDVFKRYILKDFKDDNEMLNVIKVYFETNFNTTLAAKNCYMHRNTFLNKLDKFSQETDFNLKNYDDAMIVYLAIMM